MGVARFVMRSKQYLCAIRPKDGALVLSTMVYADEVNEPAEIGEIADLEDVELTKKELDMARQLIASLSADFDADRFEDTYRNQVLDLIERKAAGDTEIVAPPEVMTEDKVVDLMAALEASVKEAKAARTRHPAGAPGRRGEAGAGQEAHPQVRVARTVADQLVEVDGRQLKVTNLDKVLYPDAGFTKAEVIDYYVRVAPVMVPHIGDRGVTLRRYPNGVDEQSFFEKRCASHRPEWIGVFQGPGDRNGTIGYCALDSDRRAGVVGQHGGARDPRADGPRQGHRVAHDVRVRPRPGPAHRHPRVRRGGPRHPPGARQPRRARVPGQDVGLEGPAGVRAPQHASTPTSTAPSSPRRWPRCWRSTTRSGSRRRWPSRPARARCSSTGARTAATRRRWRCTRSEPGRGPTVSTPVTWDEVEEAAGGGDLSFEAADVLARVEEHGDLFAATLDGEAEAPEGRRARSGRMTRSEHLTARAGPSRSPSARSSASCSDDRAVRRALRGHVR